MLPIFGKVWHLLFDICGSGKSTLPALLMRFYDPTDGVVKVDGTDVRDFSPDWLRTHMSIVHQVPASLASYWRRLLGAVGVLCRVPAGPRKLEKIREID